MSDADSDFELVNQDSTALQIQELKNKIVKLEEEKNLEIKILQATVDLLTEEISGSPICQNITGSWKPNSPIELALQLEKFPEEKRLRFEKLLKAETENNVAKYNFKKGSLFHWSTLGSKEFKSVASYTRKTWTNNFTFPDGQKGEVVKKMEGDKLKMVLKSNGEEMVVKWERTSAFDPEHDLSLKTMLWCASLFVPLFLLHFLIENNIVSRDTVREMLPVAACIFIPIGLLVLYVTMKDNRVEASEKI